MRRCFVIAIVVLAALLSGCVSETEKGVGTTATPTTQTPTSTIAVTTPTPMPATFNEDELVKRIDTELNPKKYVKYIDYINVAKKGKQLNVSYVSYAAGWEGAIYRQMMRVIDVVNEYLNERDTGIEITKFRVVHRSGDEYVFEIATKDMTKLLNEQCGFIEWKKAVEYGEKYVCAAQPVPLGTRMKDISQIVEEAFRTSDGSVYLDYVNARIVGDVLVVGYASYVPSWESDVYGQMVEVMKVLLDYMEKKGMNVDKVKIVHTLRDDGEYVLQVSKEEMKKFISGEWGFKEWKSKVLKREL